MENKVDTARDWLSQDSFRLKRSLAREEVEIVVASLVLTLSEQAELYEFLEQDGIYKCPESKVENQDESEDIVDSYILSRSLSLDAKPSSSPVISRMLSHRVLRKEEEQVLARKIFLARDVSEDTTDKRELVIAREGKDAEEIMMLFNLRLVWSCAEYYQSLSGMDAEDLMQEGILGLLRAIQKFDYSRDLKFSTYAVWWIRQAITRAIQNSGALIRIPSYLHSDISRYKKAKNIVNSENIKALCSSSKLIKVSEELNWPLEKVLFISQVCLLKNVTSTDLVDQNLQELSRIPCSNGNFARAIETGEFNAFVVEVAGTLSEREFDILKRRFAISDVIEEETLEKIGVDYNLTRERIRQIEARALKRLRPRLIALGINKENLNEWLR